MMIHHSYKGAVHRHHRHRRVLTSVYTCNYAPVKCSLYARLKLLPRTFLALCVYIRFIYVKRNSRGNQRNQFCFYLLSSQWASVCSLSANTNVFFLLLRVQIDGDQFVCNFQIFSRIASLFIN